ncbi:MAG: hypothetical protein WD709_05000 [Gammaproteobacteria bacterium]
MEKHQQQFSLWYFIFAFTLLLIQNYFFSTSVEVLSYGSFKTLPKAGKLSDISIDQQSISGPFINDDLAGQLPDQQLQTLRQSTVKKVTELFFRESHH